MVLKVLKMEGTVGRCHVEPEAGVETGRSVVGIRSMDEGVIERPVKRVRGRIEEMMVTAKSMEHFGCFS